MSRPLGERLASWIGGAGGPAGPWELPLDGTLRLRPGPGGLALRCHAGTVLVTQEGDPLAHVLGPGDELRTRGRRLVVAWALSAASLGARPLPRRPGRAGAILPLAGAARANASELESAEESPGTAGQGAGQRPVGVTRRKVPQR